MTMHLSASPQLHVPQTPRQTRAGPALFGTLLVEAVLPWPELSAPAIEGWEVRSWPVARLGDVTLEARPLRPELGPQDLRGALAGAGITPLGPIHERS